MVHRISARDAEDLLIAMLTELRASQRIDDSEAVTLQITLTQYYKTADVKVAHRASIGCDYAKPTAIEANNLVVALEECVDLYRRKKLMAPIERPLALPVPEPIEEHEEAEFEEVQDDSEVPH